MSKVKTNTGRFSTLIFFFCFFFFFFPIWKHAWLNFLRIFQLGDGCTSLQSEINNSLTSGQATVKRDLVLAPGRQGEAVCPLNALLQSQQPLANSLSLVCRTLCSAARLPVRLSATQHMPCWRRRPFTHSGYLGPSDRLSICQSKWRSAIKYEAKVNVWYQLLRTPRIIITL